MTKKQVLDLLKTKSYVNISLGGGKTTARNFINVDIKAGPEVDVVHDLETYPWPFPDNCADLLVASHIVEHINPVKGGFIKFMDECWRILKPEGQMMIATPYAGSFGYWQDPTHVNGCNEATWYYFDPLQHIDGKNLYGFYTPKPWKVANIAWHQDSNLEVVMERGRTNPMVKLNLGSGIGLKEGFINVDLYYPDDLKNKTGVCKNAVWPEGAEYVQADILHLPFVDNYADYVELFEVLEHIPFRNIIPVLKEVRRVMKDGAKLMLHTPNFDGLIRDWMELVSNPFSYENYENVIETIYGNQLAQGEFHHAPMNPQLINYYLVEAGFTAGKMYTIAKHATIPAFGTEEPSENSVARNELLFVEVIK